jgi:catechol 2,3-dioxygenase-like lactoylglutathione lyase family enzyme
VIDHISVPVSDLSRSGVFYERVLAPLGYSRLVSREATIGFGKRYPELWLNLRSNWSAPTDGGMHLCLRAQSEESVRAFHEEALACGGTDDGAPGPRQAEMTPYFAAFVRDPDGNKLEAAAFPRASN